MALTKRMPKEEKNNMNSYLLKKRASKDYMTAFFKKKPIMISTLQSVNNL
jgi:hypothetical protein